MVNGAFGGVILSTYCSNNCVFCGSQRKLSKPEVKEQEVRVLKNLIDFRKFGIKNIEISGNDPIEYDKIIALIKYIKEVGFEFVQLSTHGKRLADENFLDELILSGVNKLRVPIYGSEAKIHDSVTQTRGSFNATFGGIKKLLELSKKIQIQISCLIVNQNRDNLIGIIDLGNDLGIKDFYFSIPCVSNRDYSYYIPLKRLGPYVKKSYDYANKINFDARFMEIPYCIFGYFGELMDNKCSPPNLGRFCQPEDRSPVKDLPKYRLKKKVKMCKKCVCSNFCDGFFVNDIERFGIGNLRPINKKG